MSGACPCRDVRARSRMRAELESLVCVKPSIPAAAIAEKQRS